MSTLISSVARAARLGLAGLAAGLRRPRCRCSPPGRWSPGAAAHTAAGRPARATRAAGRASASSAAPRRHAASAGAPSASSAAPATPVPTISGGPVEPGQPACAGWPAGAVSVSLPVSFVPVSVERCVNGAQTIPGKGLWTTATLQRADSGLAALISALRQPPATHHPGPSAPPWP